MSTSSPEQDDSCDGGEKGSHRGNRPYVPTDLGKARYIGSKARVVDEIIDLIGPPSPEDGFFVDAFCGTGVVGARAADLGWPIRFNDNLRSAVAVSTARLVSARDVPFEA